VAEQRPAPEAPPEANYRLGHGGLLRLMHRIESGVTIGRVAARLVREHPVLTVHDSILTPPGREELVRRVISEEWMGEFGVVPGMKSSRWTAPQPARVGRGRPDRPASRCRSSPGTG
jgi:hypothetical protein